MRAFSSRQLARPRSAPARDTIGVLVAGYDPFYLPFLAGVEAAAAASRALTTVCVTEDNPVKGRIQLDRLVATGVLGIIAASVGALVEVELEGESGPIPIVYCDQPDMTRHSIVFDAPGGRP